ncbi:MAG: metal-dependent hydrolase [Abditibacteriota bacterium]|nr:metal-dependent hydrolase [Abditibacteriota bacterium]
MKITCIGHASILIEAERNILTDPYITGDPHSGIRIGELPRIDVILLTHGHGDHLGDTVRIAAEHGSLVVAPVELARLLGRQGVKCHPMNFGSADLGFGRLTMFPATHSSSITENGVPVYTGNPCGYVIRAEGKKLYFAGDTGLMAHMSLLADEALDCAFLPVGGNFTMDAEDAVRAAQIIGARINVPIHYDAMPQITLSPEDRDRLARAGFLFIRPGEKIEL